MAECVFRLRGIVDPTGKKTGNRARLLRRKGAGRAGSLRNAADTIRRSLSCERSRFLSHILFAPFAPFAASIPCTNGIDAANSLVRPGTLLDETTGE